MDMVAPPPPTPPKGLGTPFGDAGGAKTTVCGEAKDELLDELERSTGAGGGGISGDFDFSSTHFSTVSDDTLVAEFGGTVSISFNIGTAEV